MSCVLRAAGSTFDVDGFLASTNVTPSQVWRKGEVRSRGGGRQSQNDSGLGVLVSDAGLTDWRQQVDDAIAFLKTHAAMVAELRSFSGVDTVVLDFGVRPKSDMASQTYRLPTELLQLTSELRLEIEISCYLM